MTNTPLISPAPPKPVNNVLEDRWLHKAMVFCQSFQQRPVWFNGLLLMGMIGSVFLFWLLISPATTRSATFVFASLVLLDLIILWYLPQQHISFGPIAPQLIVMLAPRLIVVGVAALIALWQIDVGLVVLGSGQLLGTLVYLWGLLIEPHRLQLTSFSLTTSKMPAGSKPLRLLHLSDLHLERLTRREAKLLKLINKTAPDLILISGDYLNLSYNADSQAIKQVRILLTQIHAPLGVYAVLGSPPVDLPHIASQHFKNTNIQLLHQHKLSLNLGQGRQLRLLGLDCTHDMTYDAYQLQTLIQQTETTNLFTIFLYHSPELMPVAQKHDIDLYLCGHTHGGQVRLPGYGAIITSAVTGKQYEMGRYDEHGTTLYVSRGIGLEGMSAPRLRLFCPPEITLITINPE